MEYLKDKLFNKAELARKMNMSPELFRMKLNNVNYNKFNSEELITLIVILKKEATKTLVCLKKMYELCGVLDVTDQTG